MPSASPPVYHIYCDESRHTAERFMILAGIRLRATAEPGIKAMFDDYQRFNAMHAELKWRKVSRYKLAEYKRFLDYFLTLNTANQVHFKSIVLDTHQFDHRRFNAGDAEIGFYKFYYQLLLHCFGGPDCSPTTPARFIVFLDQRTSRFSLRELRQILNYGMASKFGVRSNPFVAITPLDSKTSVFVQVVDVVSGAVGYHWNQLHLVPGASEARCELAAYLAHRLGFKDLATETAYSMQRFKIWKMRLQERGAP